ncbi:nucleotidyltransferase domain-containing protein [Sphingomonas jaspsi]|uniref:nucleotidyltransferase domain-containing protein n=1 Tax=Sphingomonas jaspsi TaxID=392409 RepID=UPI0004AEF42E|nr:nucleotidyltransferase family protein [Sphingomonas jaspsi]
MPGDHELSFLILAVRSAYEPSARAKLAMAKGVAWTSFTTLAARHRVEGLAWDGLVAANADVPAELAAILRKRATAIAAGQLQALTAAATIQQSFDAQQIDLLFLKGFTLAALTYPHPQAKDSCDIDVLVSRSDIAKAAGALRTVGFENTVPGPARSATDWHQSRKESVWVHPGSGQQVDLHSRLADNPALIQHIDLSAARQQVELGNRTFATLADAPLYAYLCVHGASSAWFRLKWLADLHAFVLANGTGKLMTWHEQAVESGVGRPSFLALRLLEKWFDFPLPRALISGGAGLRAASMICNRQLAATQEPTMRHLGTVTIHLLQMLQRPGAAFAFGEAVRQIGEILRR